jgi:glycosyltransferase involved in cell wall biosynthesis
MKVALVFSLFPKSPFDIRNSFVFDEAYELSRRGIEIHATRAFVEDLTKIKSNFIIHGLKRKIELEAIPFFLRHLKWIPLLANSSLFSPYWFSNYGYNIVENAMEFDVDVIHAHFAYPDGLIGLACGHETSKPFCLTLHGHDILTESSVGYGVRRFRFLDNLVRKVLKNTDTVIVGSKAVFKEALKAGAPEENLHLIYNGVDTERFNPDIKADEIVDRYRIANRNVVFTLRHHEPKYGLEYLIRAIPAIVKKKKNTIFIIGGDGSLRCYHEQLVKKLKMKNHVVFTGAIHQSLLPKYYAACDLFVIPSLQEAFGLVVSEAMACGKPVVGTNVGGIPEQIIDHYNGFLVEPRDHFEMADRVLWLLDNPEKSRQMGLNGRRIVEEKFSLDRRIEKIISLYNYIQ